MLGSTGTAVAGGGIASAVVWTRKNKKPDPEKILDEYNAFCEALCRENSRVGVLADSRREAEAKLAEIDQAYFKALTYLDNQLRKDYIFLREIHQMAGVTLAALPILATTPLGLGPELLGVGGAMGYARWDPADCQGNEAHWNALVNARQQWAHDWIETIHEENRLPWQYKLAALERAQDQNAEACFTWERNLIELRATYDSEVQFPKCRCEQ